MKTKPEDIMTRTSVLPELPVVPAVRGEAFPAGFTPLDDTIELEREIRIAENLRVVGKMTTKGGKAAIKIDFYNRPGYGQKSVVPVEYLDATVVAMNFLKAWLAAEGERLLISPAPITTKDDKRKPVEDDEDEDSDEGSLPGE